MRVRGLVPAVLLAAFVLGLSPAHAASLPLTGSGLLAFSRSRCSSAIIPTAPSDRVGKSGKANSISITAPPACGGLPYVLTSYTSSGALVATSAGSLSSTGFATASPGRYRISDVDGVALTINTWGVQTSWTP